MVTPEYNGSIPGVLKNAIDWASHPRDDAVLHGKTVAVAGATTGHYGAIWAQQDLRRVLGIAGARVIEGDLPVSRAHNVFDEDLRLTDAAVRDRLGRHVEALVTECRPVAVAAEASSPRTTKGRESGPSSRTVTSVGLVEALPARPP